MLKFEIGQPLPLPLLSAPGTEKCLTTFNEAFFDIVYWIPDNDSSIVFARSKLQYGLFVANEVPFFIVDFPGKNWNFDVNMNIKKVVDDKLEAWLNGKGNIINLYLCNCKTNILYAMRMISIIPEVAEKIKDVLEKQDEKYSDSKSVDQVIMSVLDSFTTAEMMAKIKMYKL